VGASDTIVCFLLSQIRVKGLMEDALHHQAGRRRGAFVRAAAALVALVVVGIVSLHLVTFQDNRSARAIAAVGEAISAAEHSSCGLVEDGIEYHSQSRLQRAPIAGITSAAMCCSECEADPSCGAWTWGKQRDIVGLSDLCFLKELDEGEVPVRLQRREVISGLPLQKVRKHGVRASMRVAAQVQRYGNYTQEVPQGVLADETCSESLSVDGYGYGNVSIYTLPGSGAGQVDVLEGEWIVPHLNSRAYFTDKCRHPELGMGPHFAKLKLLGKTIRYTTDLSGAGCGCNAELRLVAASPDDIEKENSGFRIDLQGGNQYAWSSQLHVQRDWIGISVGYGGGEGDWNGKRDWTGSEFGPGGGCIDTSNPFDVAVSFPTDEDGVMLAMEVTLSQFGKSCPLFARLDDYEYENKNGIQALSKAFEVGFTPSISYSAADDLSWLDGLGKDGKGPCVKDVPKACPNTVRFYGFSVEPIGKRGPNFVERKKLSSPLFGAPLSGLPHDPVMQAVSSFLDKADRPQPRAPGDAGTADTNSKMTFVQEEKDMTIQNPSDESP